MAETIASEINSDNHGSQLIIACPFKFPSQKQIVFGFLSLIFLMIIFFLFYVESWQVIVIFLNDLWTCVFENNISCFTILKDLKLIDAIAILVNVTALVTFPIIVILIVLYVFVFLLIVLN